MAPHRHLHILEDGAGKGVFLAQLKKKAAMEGVHCHTTALALKTRPELAQQHDEGKIDAIRSGFAETFVPTKAFDVIVSLFGSIHYTSRQHSLYPMKANALLEKNHLLKMAHCLQKGGILMAGFSHLSLDQKTESRIQRAFQKQGFRAVFAHNPSGYEQDLPEDILIL